MVEVLVMRFNTCAVNSLHNFRKGKMMAWEADQDRKTT